MAIRFPLQTVLDYNQTVEQGGGPTSIAGGRAITFTIPQDTDNVVVKYMTSMAGGGASVTLQTTDDSGTTWYDVARSSVISNQNNTTAVFMAIPIMGDVGANVQASLVAVGSVVSVNASGGSAAASSLSQRTTSGLPIMSPLGRVFIQYGNAITSIMNERVQVKVNSQSATA